MSLYAFRLPDALIGEVDREGRRIEAEQQATHPGASVTRAVAVRLLLSEALQARKSAK